MKQSILGYKLSAILELISKEKCLREFCIVTMAAAAADSKTDYFVGFIPIDSPENSIWIPGKKEHSGSKDERNPPPPRTKTTALNNYPVFLGKQELEKADDDTTADDNVLFQDLNSAEIDAKELLKRNGIIPSFPERHKQRDETDSSVPLIKPTPIKPVLKTLQNEPQRSKPQLKSSAEPAPTKPQFKPLLSKPTTTKSQFKPKIKPRASLATKKTSGSKLPVRINRTSSFRRRAAFRESRRKCTCMFHGKEESELLLYLIRADLFVCI